MSLRARLLVGLVVLVSTGLAVAGIPTYTAQRAFLYNRVDQQVASAVQPISQQLGTLGGAGFAGGAGGGTGATGAGGAPAGLLFNRPPAGLPDAGRHPDGD